MHHMPAFVCITGASSGIGRALALSVPFDPCTLVTVNRRPGPRGEWIEADLGDPAAWPVVSGRIAQALVPSRHDRAVLLHFAGIGAPHATTAQADLDEYTSAVLLNSAAGPVLAKAFISECSAAEVAATVVLCSSPGAAMPMPGMSHYGAGKLAMEYWTRAVAAEDDGVRALAVVPYAVDTPMVREVIGKTEGAPPIAAILRAAAERGELASAYGTAAEIWRLVVDDGVESGSVVPVGAVPAGMPGAT